MLLEVEGLAKAYRAESGARFSLRDVNFTVQQGEVKAILGRNGSGKSTIIKCLAGLVTPDKMTLRYQQGFAALRRDLSVLIEGKDSLIPRLSALENARYFGTIRAGRVEEAYLKALAHRLGLQDGLNEQVRRLSTGNKRRAALLVALCTRPKVVFLDEPTLGLDAVAAQSVMLAIHSLAAAEGAAFVITSHNAEFIERVANTLLILADGTVAYDGPFDAYMQRDREISITVDLAKGVNLPKDFGYVAGLQRPQRVSRRCHSLRELRGELDKLHDYEQQISRIDVGKGRLRLAHVADTTAE